jgi:hypothetical protein
MRHPQRIVIVTRQFTPEEALLQMEPDHHEGDRYGRAERRRVRLKPESETDEDQRIGGIEWVTNDSIYP